MEKKKSNTNKGSTKKTVATKKNIKMNKDNNYLIVKIIIAIILIAFLVFLVVKACDGNKSEEKQNLNDKVVENNDNKIPEKEDEIIEVEGVEPLPETNYSNVSNDVVATLVVKPEEPKNDETVVEPPAAVLDTSAPVVTGVSENGIYSSVVIEAIDDKTNSSDLIALIDGNPYVINTEYAVNGEHVLEIIDEAGNSTVINFIIATIVDANTTLSSEIAKANDGDIIILSVPVNENIDIDKSIVLKGTDSAVVNGYLNITNGDVVLDGIIINNSTQGITYSGSNVTLVKVDTTGRFVMKNSVISGNSFYARNAITVNNAESVEITGNTFGDGNIYNYIEFGGNTIIKNGTNISFNTFTSQSCTHNQINLYNFEENAVVNINNNYFEKSANAVRIANRNNATATINMMNNKYDETDSDLNWAGLFLIQPWDSALEDFNTITINVESLTGPDGNAITSNVPGTINQVYYLWDTTSSPVINIR